MAKKQPGLFDRFNGLWVRGHVDDTPPDHFSDCLNLAFNSAGVGSGDATVPYISTADIVRMALYKPSPPFIGTNVPRIIALKSNGDLIDILLGTTIYSNPLMKDFGFVNFFGRAYISPSDGKVGLQNEFVRVYDGTGVSGFRVAGGVAPTAAMTGVIVGGGTLLTGDYIFSYAYETSSGFITSPAPFLKLNTNFFPNVALAQLANIGIGPAGTVARWLIVNKVIPYPTTYNGNPTDYPVYFVARIADNTTTTYNLTFYDGNLVDSADFLYTSLSTIPAGVGLIDYKGRMISYGEFANPSVVRGSTPGEPESFSSTSGFFIIDPSDSTGVRAAVDFRGLLYIFKRHRGYVTEDNGLDLSTWNPINFEKAIGTENYGIGAVLDAKGAQSNGFIIASLGALYFFNGTIVEPELSYKIRDLWLSINEKYFHLVQVAIHPDRKKIYILVPLYDSTTISHIIEGDYRDGLDPMNIQWSKTVYSNNPRSILIYEDFTLDSPSVVVRLAKSNKIVTINVGVQGSDDGAILPSFFQLCPVRFSEGVSEFNLVRIRIAGPCHIQIDAYGEDLVLQENMGELYVPSQLPGMEYTVPVNLVSEQCRLRIGCDDGDFYKINRIQIYGQHLWFERPR